jgi:folate-binding Fe-S cluster repair protein YgfZ
MLRLVEVRGSGAAEFLQRVTAGTVKDVKVGQGRAGILLNGQSRVLAQFDLLRLKPELYQLAAPEECAAALAKGLEALHFAEDLEITLSDSRMGVVVGKEAARAEPFAVGGDLLWPSPVPGFAFSAATQLVANGFEFARIGALVPWPGQEWLPGAVTPALEAGMLPWIDRHKGCYPGQEVVELSLNVGHPVRVLVACEGNGSVENFTSSAEEAGKRRVIVKLSWAKKDFTPPGFSRLVAQF